MWKSSFRLSFRASQAGRVFFSILYPNMRTFLPPPRLSGLSASGHPGVLMGAHSALPATHG
jgi:hypothetical protein